MTVANVSGTVASKRPSPEAEHDAPATDVPADPMLGERVAAAVNPHRDEEPEGRPWSGFATQVVLITAASLLYFGVRMVTKDAEAAAFRNAERLLDFERSIGLDIELWAQEQILGSDAVVTFFNWIYIWLHWPVIICSLLWLYRNHRHGFVLFRNALIVSGAIGLVFFVTFPVAPPRFLAGYADTVSDLSTSYKYLQPPDIVNKFAAMPSLHVGWNLLAAMVLAGVLRPPWRWLIFISPALMTISVVVTANHYIVDAVAGAAVAVIGYLAAKRVIAWTERRQDAAAMASSPARS